MAKRRERRARAAGRPCPPARHFPRTKAEITAEGLLPLRIGIAENIELRRLRAVELRIAGYTFKQIAAALSCGVDTAYEDYRAEMAHIAAAKTELAEDALRLELQRLDTLQAAWWTTALSGTDPHAARVVLKCLDQRARLLGLYPLVPANGGGLSDSVIDVTPDAVLVTRIQQTHDRLAAATARVIDWSAFDAAGAVPSGGNGDNGNGGGHGT